MAQHCFNVDASQFGGGRGPWGSHLCCRYVHCTGCPIILRQFLNCVQYGNWTQDNGNLAQGRAEDPIRSYHWPNPGNLDENSDLILLAIGL